MTLCALYSSFSLLIQPKVSLIKLTLFVPYVLKGYKKANAVMEKIEFFQTAIEDPMDTGLSYFIDVLFCVIIPPIYP